MNYDQVLKQFIEAYQRALRLFPVLNRSRTQFQKILGYDKNLNKALEFVYVNLKAILYEFFLVNGDIDLLSTYSLLDTALSDSAPLNPELKRVNESIKEVLPQFIQAWGKMLARRSNQDDSVASNQAVPLSVDTDLVLTASVPRKSDSERIVWNIHKADLVWLIADLIAFGIISGDRESILSHFSGPESTDVPIINSDGSSTFPGKVVGKTDIRLRKLMLNMAHWILGQEKAGVLGFKLPLSDPEMRKKFQSLSPRKLLT